MSFIQKVKLWLTDRKFKLQLLWIRVREFFKGLKIAAFAWCMEGRTGKFIKGKKWLRRWFCHKQYNFMDDNMKKLFKTLRIDPESLIEDGEI